MKNIFLALLLNFTFFSCTNTSVQVSEYDAEVSSFKIDKSKNYNQVLQTALNLDQERADRVRKILTTYRTNRKKNPEKENKLRKNREQKLSRVLSKVEMKQRKYVNAVFYESTPDYPAHPINIQKKYSLADGQVLKLIEIEERHKLETNLELRKKRIFDLLGDNSSTQYLESKGLAI